MTVSDMIDVQGGVLVAHDGSRHAADALLTAVRFAEALKTHVTVARVWNLSTAPRPASWEFGYVPPLVDFESETLAALDRDISSVCAENPDMMITSRVVYGSPAKKLIEASGRADLIVVGSRGTGGFAGLLLGSVGEQVVRHSRCPVLVDKPTDRPNEKPAETDETVAEDDRERMEQALVSELKLE